MFFTLLSFTIIIIHIFLCIKNLTYGCAFVLFIHQIFPAAFRIGGVSMNTALVLILTIFVVVRNFNRLFLIPSKYTYPIKSFALPLLCLTIFAPLPFAMQFNAWFQFLVTEILTSIFLLLSIKTEKDFKTILYILLSSYIIIGIYGIFTYIWHMNPLYDLFNTYYGAGISFTGDGEEQIRGGLSSFTSGNMSGPLPWGQCSLVILMSACFLPKGYRTGWITNIVIILSIINCLLCGKRSVILPMLIVVSYYIFTRYLYIRKKGKAILCICFILTTFTFLQRTEYIKNIETAIFFWNDNLAEKNQIGGSSTAMRLTQFEYANDMISDNTLCGLGYNYIGYYSSRYGRHPIMLGFESIYFQVIVQSGIIGLIIWIAFFYRNYIMTNNSSMLKKDAIIMHGAYVLSLI